MEILFSLFKPFSTTYTVLVVIIVIKSDSSQSLPIENSNWPKRITQYAFEFTRGLKVHFLFPTFTLIIHNISNSVQIHPSIHYPFHFFFHFVTAAALFSTVRKCIPTDYARGWVEFSLLHSIQYLRPSIWNILSISLLCKYGTDLFNSQPRPFVLV